MGEKVKITKSVSFRFETIEKIKDLMTINKESDFSKIVDRIVYNKLVETNERAEVIECKTCQAQISSKFETCPNCNNEVVM